MYVPLYIKTDGSLLKSLIKIDELIKKARKQEFEALTITDNNMYNVMPFYKKCLENNIKPIVGLEIIIDNLKLVLYAKNYKGYLNLVKISSEEIKDIDLLKKYNNDLILIIPFPSISLYEKLKETYENIYFAYKNDEEYNSIKSSKKVYMNEILFLEQNEEEYIYYLEAIKKGILVNDIQKNKSSNYLRTKELYQMLDKDIKNNYEINELCNLKIIKEDDVLPVFDTNGLDAYTYLKEECKKGLIKRFGNTVKKVYQERLKKELEVINKMGFCNYFLIVQDYVNFAKQKGILVGPGRGSAAGSLVSYVLNITDVDPIKYNLLFERFLNEMRITMPDIDMDFEFIRREEVINYCIEKYGEKKVAGIITFGTLAAKQAIRDVGKCLNIPLSKIDYLAKQIDSKLTLKDNLNNEVIKNILNDESLLKVYKVATKLEGLKRHTSIHAAGIVMCKKNLNEIVPIEKKGNMYVTSYSMEYLEELGLLKMDFLALKTLTTINRIITEVNKDELKIDYNNIPLNDNLALNIFTEANTIGIFQFESVGMINFLKKFKPTTFEDLFACLALYRPGPMDNIDSYIRRKNGFEKIDYMDQVLEPILKPTYGIMIYQEQIMQVASTLAGYTLGEADILRRAISKKKEQVLLEEKEKFVRKTIEQGHSLELGEKVFNYILKFASYGFNRSHSVGYAFISYKMAYLKAHYPKEFMKCLLDSAIDSSTNTAKYVSEARSNNLVILPPDINESGSVYVIKDNKILYPLHNIKNIGDTVVESILTERAKGKFINIYDFIRRIDKRVINRKVIESLILVGAFDTFKMTRKTLYTYLDEIINYGEIIKEVGTEYTLEPVIEDVGEFSKVELLNFELDLLGFYLTDNPISLKKKNYPDSVSLININAYYGKIIDTVLMVSRMREITTKKGDKMCFIEGKDEVSQIDLVLFDNVIDKITNLNINDIILVRGKVEKRFDKYQIVVNNLKILD